MEALWEGAAEEHRCAHPAALHRLPVDTNAEALRCRAAGAALPAALTARVADVVPALEAGRLVHGKGGEVMRGAVCR